MEGRGTASCKTASRCTLSRQLECEWERDSHKGIEREHSFSRFHSP